MTQPPHDEIARKAHALWKDRGCPQGIDNEIWFEAERQLRGDQPPGKEAPESFQRRVQMEAAAESRDEFNLSASTTEQQAIRAGVQRANKPAPKGAQTVRSSVKGGSGQSGLG